MLYRFSNSVTAPAQAQVAVAAGQPNQGFTLYRDYGYGGGYWAVPHGFKFPKNVGLRLAWSAWLIGYPGNRSGGTVSPVRPLRFITSSSAMLPTTVRSEFNNGWKPVLTRMMDKARQFVCRVPTNQMNASFIVESYNIAMDGLKEDMPSLFEGKNKDRNKLWKVSTWSRKVRGH